LALRGLQSRISDSAMIDKPEPRRFPQPWSVEEPDSKLDRRCFIVRDANGHALTYVYFEGELDRRSAAHLLTREEARRIAAKDWLRAEARFLGLKHPGRDKSRETNEHLSCLVRLEARRKRHRF
jgi:hypothetical protein